MPLYNYTSSGIATGTSGTLPKFQGTSSLTDSIVSEASSVLTVAGSLTVTGTNALFTSDSIAIKLGASSDVILSRNAANVLQMRNGTSAQGILLYNTYTSDSVYERGFMRCTGTVFQMGTEQVGGTNRNFNFSVGGTTVFSATATGVTITGTGVVTSTFESGNRLAITSTSMWKSATDGHWTALNAAQTGFTRLNLGGITSSFPAIKVNGTGIDFRVADDSAYCSIQSLYKRVGSGSPESSVTAPVGATYHRTDGGASTSFYVKESGSGNTGWVAK